VKLLGLVVGLASLLTITYLMAESFGWTEERRVAAAIEALAREGWGRVGVGLAVVPSGRTPRTPGVAVGEAEVVHMRL
jgi:hypothetical protein